MATPTTIPEDDFYCTAQDVVDYLGLDITLSEDSDPTKAYVDRFVMQAMSEMEAKTNRAWRTKPFDKVVRDIPPSWVSTRGVPIYLSHTDVKEFDTNEGDMIEAWDGKQYRDVTNDISLSELPSMGKIWIRGYLWSWIREDRLRIKYRYGSELTYDVQEICIKLASIKIIERSFKLKTLAFGGNINPTEIVSTWKDDVDDFYRRHEEWVVVEH